jgi:hypothetical protein
VVREVGCAGVGGGGGVSSIKSLKLDDSMFSLSTPRDGREVIICGCSLACESGAWTWVIT